jgi:16S rRNA (uracil1498-N3)-methyltransferase
MRIGEAIQLSNGKGCRLRGRVNRIDGSDLSILVESVVQEAAPDIQIHLAQALAKGDRDELAIQAATELGAMGIIPWQADRSISKWDGPKIAKGVDRWQAIVNEAAKQSLRVYEPLVQSPASTKQLAAIFGAFDLVLILDPTAKTGLSKVQIPAKAKVLLAVGPEGGIAETELAAFEATKAVRVHLGEPILRTSTAGIAAISGLLALSGAFS